MDHKESSDIGSDDLASDREKQEATDVSHLLDGPEPDHDSNGVQLRNSAILQLMDENRKVKNKITVLIDQAQVTCNNIC